jgi:hypothetical protein
MSIDVETLRVRTGYIDHSNPIDEVAVPVDHLIEVVSECMNCEGDLRATVGSGGEVFTWHHRSTGAERCAPKKDATVVTDQPARSSTAARGDEDIRRYRQQAGALDGRPF